MRINNKKIIFLICFLFFSLDKNSQITFGGSSLYSISFNPFFLFPIRFSNSTTFIDTYVPLEPVDETYLILELPPSKDFTNPTRQQLFYSINLLIVDYFWFVPRGMWGHSLINRPYRETEPEILNYQDEFWNLIRGSLRGNCIYKIPLPVGKIDLRFAFYRPRPLNDFKSTRYELDIETSLPPAHSIFIKPNPKEDKLSYEIKPTPKGKLPCNPEGL